MKRKMSILWVMLVVMGIVGGTLHAHSNGVAPESLVFTKAIHRCVKQQFCNNGWCVFWHDYTEDGKADAMTLRPVTKTIIGLPLLAVVDVDGDGMANYYYMVDIMKTTPNDLLNGETVTLWLVGDVSARQIPIDDLGCDYWDRMFRGE